MRCANRRLTSRGVSPTKPRMARDSVETQAMTSLRAGTTLLRGPPRPADGRWHPRRQPGKQYLERSSCGTQPHEKPQPRKERPRRERMCEGGMRCRNPRPQRGLKNPGGPKCPRDGAHRQGGSDDQGNDRGQSRCHRGQGAWEGARGRAFPTRE